MASKGKRPAVDPRAVFTCYVMTPTSLQGIAREWWQRTEWRGLDFDFEILCQRAEAARKFALAAYAPHAAMLTDYDRGNAMSVYAASLLQPFQQYGLNYDELARRTTVDCAEHVAAATPDYRLPEPRRDLLFLGQISSSGLEPQIVHMAKWQQLLASSITTTRQTYESMTASSKRELCFKEQRVQLQQRCEQAVMQLRACHKLQSSRLGHVLQTLTAELSSFISALRFKDPVAVLADHDKRRGVR